jgi:dienelactone hydrolase
MTIRSLASLAALARCALLLATALTTAAQAATPTFRIEVHTLATLTLTRAQALAGTDAGVGPTTIAGELRLPFSSAERLPAVLLLHGDAGPLAGQAIWADELNALGIAVFTLDSFTARGAVATGASLATMPDSIGSAARIVDAERALALLAAHPRIDPARIAVMGFSSGGRTALLAAQTRFASSFGRAGLGFSAYIALYPDCNVRLIDDTKAEPGPLRIFIGDADVLTDAGACRRYVERLKKAGVDAAITTYLGAHHAFDGGNGGALVRIPGVPVAARCNLDEIARGTIVNIDTGRELDDGDACITKGLVAGYDAAADAAVRAAVKTLLSERFALNR